MDAFDLRNHLMNHYRKLNSVKSVVKKDREPAIGSRCSRRTSSGYANIKRHDCLTPLEKLPTYRTETSSNQTKNKDGYNIGSSLSVAYKETEKDNNEKYIDHDYAQFAWLITEDILHNRLFKVDQIKLVFQSHIEANRGRLNMAKMLAEIEMLKENLCIKDDSPESQIDENIANVKLPESEVQEKEKSYEIELKKTPILRDVAVNTTVDNHKDIGIMAIIEPPQIQKIDKEMNTSKQPTPECSLIVKKPEELEKLPNGPEPIMTSIDKYSKMGSAIDFQRKINLIYANNWCMLKRYELVTKNRDEKVNSSVTLDKYGMRKLDRNWDLIDDSFSKNGISDGEILLSTFSSISDESLEEISSANLSVC